MDKNIVSQFYCKSPIKPINLNTRVKNTVKSYIMDKNTFTPKDNKQLKEIRIRNIAYEYIDKSLNEKVNKKDFCKNKGISINTLNNGLKNMGMKIESDKNKKENAIKPKDIINILNSNINTEPNRTKKNKREPNMTGGSPFDPPDLTIDFKNTL